MASPPNGMLSGPRVLTMLLLALPLCCACPAGEDTPTGKQSSKLARSAGRLTPGFVAVKAGRFSMGSSEKEHSRYTNEQQHRVTLTRDFEISSTEVTQAQFEAVMGYNPSAFTGCPRCPVETVSWHEAAAYCNALSKKAGLTSCYSCKGSGPAVACVLAAAFRARKVYDCPGYRLPTDAEWEYACRAGTTTAFYNGESQDDTRVTCTKEDPVANAIGWYCQNAGRRTHPVGEKKPNAWGLHDMGGNVWEWCNDVYLAVLKRDETDPWGIAASDSPMRVTRGGSWKYFSRGMRSACRAWYTPSYRGNRHGFRPARTR
jgi:formylglycine-generating enzyme required for sulfatase activity